MVAPPSSRIALHPRAAPCHGQRPASSRSRLGETGISPKSRGDICDNSALKRARSRQHSSALRQAAARLAARRTTLSCPRTASVGASNTWAKGEIFCELYTTPSNCARGGQGPFRRRRAAAHPRSASKFRPEIRFRSRTIHSLKIFILVASSERARDLWRIQAIADAAFRPILSRLSSRSVRNHPRAKAGPTVTAEAPIPGCAGMTEQRPPRLVPQRRARPQLGPRALILRRRLYLAPERVGGVPTPARVIEKSAG